MSLEISFQKVKPTYFALNLRLRLVVVLAAPYVIMRRAQIYFSLNPIKMTDIRLNPKCFLHQYYDYDANKIKNKRLFSENKTNGYSLKDKGGRNMTIGRHS